jgi:hypothetical protein
MVEENRRRSRLNPTKWKGEEGQKSSKKVGKVGRSSMNVEKYEIEEMAGI